MPSKTPTFFQHIILFIVLLPMVTGAGSDEDEFAVNVFTDLAPLLALFGEQFARQFISESLTWLDHIIFAMVPLGIITAIVSAIRVSGPSWARAFIGRARETRATAELELLSSTSREVCEVYNGRGVVRTLGTPRLTQLIIFPQQYLRDDLTCGIHTLQTAYESKPRLLDKGRFGLWTSWDSDETLKKDEEKVAEESDHDGGEHSSRPHLRFIGRVRKSLCCDPELGNALGPPGEAKPDEAPVNARKGEAGPDKPAVSAPKGEAGPNQPAVNTPEGEAEPDKSAANEPEFPPELKGAGPNLQLNLPMSYHFHHQSIGKLWSAAAVAVVIQLAVIIISAITTLHRPISEKVGKPKATYWFWLFIGGTVILNIGMMLSSLVIEKKTKEYAWRRKGIESPIAEKNAENGRDKKVSSTTDDVKASSENTTRPTNSKSSKPDHMPSTTKVLASKSEIGIKEAKMQLLWLQQKHTVNDQVFDAFLILGGEKTEILTSAIPPSIGKVQLPAWMDKTLPEWMMKKLSAWTKKMNSREAPVLPEWVKKIAADRFEFLSIVGASFGVAGFILQFEGMRGLAWPTAVAQLVAILLMALVRAVVRRRLGTDLSTVPAKAEHELDWLALRLVFDNAPLETEGDSGTALIPQWRVRTSVIPKLEPTPSEDPTNHAANATPSEPPNSKSEQPRRLLAKEGTLEVKSIDKIDNRHHAVDCPKTPLRLFPPTSQMLLDVRRRLGELTECPGAAYKEAIALSQAISLTLNELCPMQLGKDERGIFTWSLNAIMDRIPPKEPKIHRNKTHRRKSMKRVMTAKSKKSSKDVETARSTDPEYVEDSITLQAICDKDGWNISPLELDAILSLWMSRDSFTDPIVDDTSKMGGEPSDWLTQRASVTLKYGRILGENPPRYVPQGAKEGRESSISTNILTRDLNWWTNDSRIFSTDGDRQLDKQPDRQLVERIRRRRYERNNSQPYERMDRQADGQVDRQPNEIVNDRSMALPSTGKITITIGFNGVDVQGGTARGKTKTPENRNEERKVTDEPNTASKAPGTTKKKGDNIEHGEVVSIISSGPLASILANHLFSCFMWALSGKVASEKIGKAKVEDSELFDHTDFKNTWNLPTLRSKRLMKLARDIEGFGLGRTEDILLAIIPPLSFRGILPTGTMMSVLTKKAKEHERHHDWTQVQKAYSNLLKLDLYPERMDCMAYEVVVELIEFLFSAKEGVDDLRALEIAPREKMEGQSWALQQAVRTLSEELASHDLLLDVVEQLQWFYLRQNRKENFEKLLKSLDSYIKHSGRPRVNKTHRSTNSDPDSEVMKIAKFDLYHKFSSTKISEEDKKDRQPQSPEHLEVNPDIFGWYPLHYAAVLDDDDVFQVVINDTSRKKGKDYHDLTNRSGRTPLHYAAMYKNEKKPKDLTRIKLLTANNYLGNSTCKVEGRNGMTPIHCAARYGGFPAFRELTQYSDLSTVDVFGRSALHLGIIAGNMLIVEFLLGRGDDAIVRSGEESLQRTALHFALIFDREENHEMVKAIVKSERHLKAIDINDDQKQTPIHLIMSKSDCSDLFSEILDNFPDATWPKSADVKRTVAMESFTATMTVLLGLKPDGSKDLREKHEAMLRRLFKHVIEKNWGFEWVGEAFSIAFTQERFDMLPILLQIVKSLSNESNVAGEVDSSSLHAELPETNMGEASLSQPTEILSSVRQHLKSQHNIKKLPVLVWSLRNGKYSIYEELETELDIASNETGWNDKDSENRTPLAYFAKAKPASSSDDVLSTEKREKMLKKLWASWDDKMKATALNTPQGRYDKTPLMYAVKNGLISLVNTFANNGANVTARDKRKWTAFYHALKLTTENNKQICEVLLSKSPQIVNEVTGEYDVPPLVTAISDRSVEMIKYLSTQEKVKPDPNLVDKDGDSPLAWCVLLNEEKMLGAVLDHFSDLDVHYRNKEGRSPLMRAYQQGRENKLEFFTELISRSLINKNEYEVTLMLAHAIFEKRADLVDLLLTTGVDTLAKDDSGRSMVYLAALHGGLETFEKIWSKTDKTNKSKTELGLVCYACLYRDDDVSKEITARLHEANIKPTLPDSNGWTIEEWSAKIRDATTISPIIPSASLGKGKREYPKPSSWSIWHAKTQYNSKDCNHPFFKKDQGKLGLTAAFPIGLGKWVRDSARVTIRADYCIPPDQEAYYWEMEILRHPQTNNEDRIVGIGICTESFNPNTMPGWEDSGSYGYHGDDGCIFINDSVPRYSYSMRPWGPGDTVGCLVDTSNPLRRSIRFFKNKVSGPTIPLGDDMHGPLYPCVGFEADSTDKTMEVEARFDVQPPGNRAVERWARIRNMFIGSSRRLAVLN